MTRPVINRRWALALLALVLVALTVRILFVAFEADRGDRYLYDSFFYKNEARALAHGHGFVEPGRVLLGDAAHAAPAADHPPMTALLLAPVAKVFDDSELAMRLFMALLGTVNVVLIALLGRAVGGRTVGVVAGALAAIYPLLWVNDGLIMSETPTVTVTLLALIAVYHLLASTRMRDAILVGVAGAAAALTRSELVLLAPALAVGIAMTARVPVRRRLQLAGASLLVALVGVAPWVGYNMSRFHRPVLISTNGELNLLGGSCGRAFYGPDTGLLGFCLPKRLPPGDQSDQAAVYRKQAIVYTRAHLFRYPVVVLARMGRTWALFRPLDMIDLNQSEGRPRWVSQWGLAFYYPVLGLAVAGVVLLVRRRRTLWPLLVTPAIVTVAALASWGQTRYRLPAEPCLVVLASVSATATWRALAAAAVRRDATTG